VIRNRNTTDYSPLNAGIIPYSSFYLVSDRESNRKGLFPIKSGDFGLCAVFDSLYKGSKLIGKGISIGDFILSVR